MSVARSSGCTWRASISHCGWRGAALRPHLIRSLTGMTSGPVASRSKAITERSAGSPGRISRILASCAEVETQMAAAPESRRMYSICLAGRVG
jgi:hypothetical protein